MTSPDRTDVAIQAAADALLSVCALQTGQDPAAAINRALLAIGSVMGLSAVEAAADQVLGAELAAMTAMNPDHGA